MAEENQTGLTGILRGIGKAAGKLLGRRGEQAERDVPSFDSGGLQIVVIGKDGEIMGTLDKSGVGEMKSKSGVGSLLGGVGKGLGKVMGDESEEPFKFDAQKFMIQQYKEEGIQPEILGEGFQGDEESLVIRTPGGGTMMILLKDFIKNFGIPPMKFKGIERDAKDQPYRFNQGGRAGYADGTPEKFMTDAELEKEFPSLARGEMYSEEYEAGKEEAIKDFIMKLREMGLTDPIKIRAAVMKQFGENRASGGRAGYQEGGVTESRVLPPEFIEAAQKTYLTDLSRQAGIPSITTAVQQQPGETAEQFANRQAQAQQFQITKAGMADLAPQVAQQDALQTAARTQAVDPTTGLGSFQPFLTKAGTAADAATGLTGAGAGTGTGTIAEYTSPFQQQVIDTTLAEFDKQRQAQQNQLAARTLGVPGAFGGGREGVQRAEFDAASDLNRSRLLADLQQRGFESASQRRQQDLANQMGIANLQSNLGARTQDLARAQISGLGTLGATQQAQNQAILDAQRQAAQMAIEEPRQALGRFGQGIAAITPGAGTVSFGETPAAAQSSPLATALGLGLAGADIYGRIF